MPDGEIERNEPSRWPGLKHLSKAEIDARVKEARGQAYKDTSDQYREETRFRGKKRITLSGDQPKRRGWFGLRRRS